MMWGLLLSLLNSININANFFSDSLSFADNLHSNTKTNPTTFVWMILMMLGMLLLLSGLLYFSLYFIKKLNKNLKNLDDNFNLKIYDTIYLNSKQGISIILLHKQAYIIGFSSSSVNLIDKITDTELLESLKKQNQNKKDFKKIFKGLINKDNIQ